MKRELTDDQAWKAVLARDARFAEVFVYGVTTTGIYCRPTCPSRRPRRSNVAFFATHEDAARGGFRPCRRCKPQSLADADACVDAARAYLDEHLDERVTLSALASHIGFSASHLQRVFLARVGLSPMAYVKAKRLERFKARVAKSKTVSAALYDAGFGSSRALYDGARSLLGMSPSEYKRGGEGIEIRYLTGLSRLGRVLVARTEAGVCAAFLGDSIKEVEGELRREFSRAQIRRDPTMQSDVEAVVRCIEGRPGAVALDLRGTDLQMRVWSLLQTIPRGETRTYRELARAIGLPKAVRAVASACAKNRVAVLVPCHRAVRTDGTPSGYRWGLARKEKLLDEERRAGR